MYKMIIFDIDGTLLKYGDQAVSKRTKDGIKKLMNNGYIVVLATGRDEISIGNVWNDLNTNYFIGANGSFCNKKDNEEIVKIINNPIKIEDFLDYKINILDNKKYEHKIANVILSEKEFIFVKNKEILKDHWFWKGYKEFYRDLNDAKNKINEENFSLITINSSCNNLKNESKKFFEETNSSLNLQASWYNGFFVSNIGVNKAKTIIQLSEIIGIDKSQIIAFGDGENDIEMLQEVGLGIAMKNGVNEVKKIANKITDKPVDEDGVIDFLEKLGVI
ncbi:MAG: YcsE-related riboflavin metabolism phosphatase [Metamycoplasmataceae bacterium]